MLAIAIQNIAPDWKYRGSCTGDNKEAFDALVSLSGIKPEWVDIEAEMPLLETERLARVSEQEAKKKERTDNILANLTFEQAESWIDENVVLTNPASVKTAFKHLARLVIALR